MTDLPSRELAAIVAAPFKDKPGEIEHFYNVMHAYADNILKTEAEWRDGIDYEALAHAIGADVFQVPWVELAADEMEWSYGAAREYMAVVARAGETMERLTGVSDVSDNQGITDE